MAEANENLTCTDEQAALWLADRRYEDLAVRCLVRRFYPKIRTYVVKNSGSADDAREVLDTALMVLVLRVRAGQYRPDAPLEAFVFAVVHHKWMDVLRRRKRDRDLADGLTKVQTSESEWHDPLEPDDPDSTRQLLAARHFADLGETCRRLLEMFYLEKKPLKQIAEEMGYSSEDSAKTMRYKCLKQLKFLIQNSTKP